MSASFTFCARVHYVLNWPFAVSQGRQIALRSVANGVDSSLPEPFHSASANRRLIMIFPELNFITLVRKFAPKTIGVRKLHWNTSLQLCACVSMQTGATQRAHMAAAVKRSGVNKFIPAELQADVSLALSFSSRRLGHLIAVQRCCRFWPPD